MNVLNIYDDQNTWFKRWGPSGTGWKGFFKKDGDEFERQAKNCRDFYHFGGGTNRILESNVVTMVRIIGKNAKHKRWNLFDKLEELADGGRKFDRINFFCHGHPRALNRGMIKQGVNLPAFAAKLKAIAADDCKIVFNSCKTGKLDDGFASTVARLTMLETMGNTKSGHATKLWAKRMFSPIYATYNVSVRMTELWPLFGGARALKKRLWSSKTAAFEFVEEVFGK